MSQKNKERKIQSQSFFVQSRSLLSFFFPILMIIFWGAGTASSQEIRHPIESRDEIFAVHFKDNKTGWVVGNKGLIAATVDGGQTWEKEETVTKNALNALVFVDNEGWVVGQKGTILHSEDGGKHWEKQGSNTEFSLMGVFFLDKQRGVATGETGVMLHTEDGGKTWANSNSDLATCMPVKLIEQGVTCINFYAVFFLDETHGWIVGDHGAILFSSNGGKDWGVVSIGNFPNLYSVYFRDDLNGWAAGQNGLLLHTVDGGKTWEKAETGTEENLYRVCMKEDFWVVTGDNGTLLQSNDGKIWEKPKIDLGVPPPWIIDVSILGSASSHKSVVLVGENVTKTVYLK